MKILVQQHPAFASVGFPDTAKVDANRPSVILIHGAANDHTVWSDLFGRKPNVLGKTRVNLLAIDLPGHGQSFAAAKPSIDGYADWMIDLLDNCGIASATLVGHSMGSLVALDCAHRHPTRVSKLGLLGAALPMPVSEALLSAVVATPDAALDQLMRWNFYLAKNADGSFPPPTPTMKAYRALLASARAGVTGNDLKACAGFHLSDAQLAGITQPTAILASAHDKMTAPAAAEALAARLPNAQLTMIERAGHAMMQDAPDDVAAWLATLIA